jgi:hypothetical protein
VSGWSGPRCWYKHDMLRLSEPRPGGEAPTVGGFSGVVVKILGAGLSPVNRLSLFVDGSAVQPRGAQHVSARDEGGDGIPGRNRIGAL